MPTTLLPLQKGAIAAFRLGPPGDRKRPSSSLNLPDYPGLLTCKFKRQGIQFLLFHTDPVYKRWKWMLKSNSNSHSEAERVRSIFKISWKTLLKVPDLKVGTFLWIEPNSALWEEGACQFFFCSLWIHVSQSCSLFMQFLGQIWDHGKGHLFGFPSVTLFRYLVLKGQSILLHLVKFHSF